MFSLYMTARCGTGLPCRYQLEISSTVPADWNVNTPPLHFTSLWLFNPSSGDIISTEQISLEYITSAPLSRSGQLSCHYIGEKISLPVIKFDKIMFLPRQAIVVENNRVGQCFQAFLALTPGEVCVIFVIWEIDLNPFFTLDWDVWKP